MKARSIRCARSRQAATIFALGVLLLTAACSESPTSPTTTADTTPAVNTLQFAGSLAAGDSRFYSFTATRTGVVSATLASLTTPPRNAAADTAIGLGIGRPAGTGCPTITSLTTASALTTQLQHTVDQGIYCVNVYDPGTVTSPLNFIVRFSFP
jgi:hypothetical protein